MFVKQRTVRNSVGERSEALIMRPGPAVLAVVVLVVLFSAAGFFLGRQTAKPVTRPRVSEQPAHFESLYRAACVLFERGEFNGCLKICEQLRQDGPLPEPVQKDLFVKRAWCLHYLKKGDQALDVIDGALGRYPRFHPLLQLKADILLMQDRYEEARPVVDLLAEELPGPRVWLSRGKLNVGLNKYAKAIENFRVVLSCGIPAFEREAATRLAILYAEKIKDFHEANRYVKVLLESDPSGFNAHATAGRVLLVQGRYEEAKSHLMKAVAQRPDHVEVLLNLAVFYDRQGDADHRALYLDMATQIDPESRTKYEALKKF
jgi:tetratricopeptide (TPR) repeat protein